MSVSAPVARNVPRVPSGDQIAVHPGHVSSIRALMSRGKVAAFAFFGPDDSFGGHIDEQGAFEPWRAFHLLRGVHAVWGHLAYSCQCRFVSVECDVAAECLCGPMIVTYVPAVNGFDDHT